MKNYDRIILYYFTGTGNALKAGRWICDEAEKQNINCQLFAIDDHYKPNPKDFNGNTLIGFLSPTHGFNIAPAMLEFILKFPIGTKSDVFILNTRAGLKFSKFFIPGISGAGQFLPMSILKMKGYAIVGGLPLDMPSNWLLIHSGLSQIKVDSIVQRCEKVTKEFAQGILNGKKVFRKVLITLPIDIALLPITFLYYIYGRFILAKTMIYTSDCNNCKICENNCPVKAIKIINDRPYWTYSCESCMRCINICPRESIQTSHLILLLILLIPGCIFNHIILKYTNLQEFMNFGFALSIFEMALTLIELFVLYGIIQRFLKFSFFSKLFEYTSLSKYWRRYLAPGITLKDFKKKNNVS